MNMLMYMFGKCGGRFGDSGIRREGNKVRGRGISLDNCKKKFLPIDRLKFLNLLKGLR